MMIELANLVAFYGLTKVLYDGALKLEEKEIVVLIGANGAGKTTTLKCIVGALPIVSGQITFNGKVINNLPTSTIVKLGISRVPEGRAIFQDMSVKENLEMGAFTRRDKNLNTDLNKIFHHFPILKMRYKQLAGTMSGGEQQMLAMARSLMARPKLWLLDEPSLGLSPLLIKEIFNIIRDINIAGTTVLLIEQNAVASLRICNRGYVMESGRITLEGRGDELAGNEYIKKAYLGA